MNTPTQLSDLGPIELVDVFEYFDGPRLFSCKDSAGQLYLAVSVQETSTSHTWLYAPLSNERYEDLESSRIDLHDAFARTEDGTVLKVTAFPEDRPSEVERLAAPDIPVEWLPAPGEFVGDPERG